MCVTYWLILSIASTEFCWYTGVNVGGSYLSINLNMDYGAIRHDGLEEAAARESHGDEEMVSLDWLYLFSLSGDAESQSGGTGSWFCIAG